MEFQHPGADGECCRISILQYDIGFWIGGPNSPDTFSATRPTSTSGPRRSTTAAAVTVVPATGGGACRTRFRTILPFLTHYVFTKDLNCLSMGQSVPKIASVDLSVFASKQDSALEFRL
jgi:hypothetical protein